jgi:hypothetical protein
MNQNFKEINVANSVFEGFNRRNGIMICGYEWGDSKADQKLEDKGASPKFNLNELHTFANKVPAYGEQALKWRYDNRIIKWFELWGHPLNREGLGGDFEKCIIQTNWCSSQNRKMEMPAYKQLIKINNIENFLKHIEYFKPNLIIFTGIASLDALQHPLVFEKFQKTAGKSFDAIPLKVTRNFFGKKFKLGFQIFENCQVIALPHPSGSIGLADTYIELFKDLIGHALEAIAKV